MTFKKFIHNVGNYKFLCGIYFMGTIIISMLIMTLYDKTSFQFITVWEILLLSMIGAGLHYIHFLKIHLAKRLTIHFIGTYLVVVLAAYLFGWTFTSNILIFSGLFIVLYALIFFAWTFYYKLEGDQLNKKLNEFKENNKK